MLRLYAALALAAVPALRTLLALGYSTTIKNRWLDYVVNCTTPANLTSSGGANTDGNLTVKLHTGDPGSSGTSNEVTGGSYAAGNIAFGAASSGSAACSGDVTFTDMPDVTVSHISLWDKAGTPLFLGGFALTAAKDLNAGDTFTLQASGTTASIT